MAAANGNATASEDYDAVVVGASLAGSSTAILLARAGARVALVEQRPDAGAFKRVCSHYIQSSAIAPIERLGLLEPMMAAGAVRSRPRIYVTAAAGWIEADDSSPWPAGINLRRELLDPLLRALAAETPGVDLLLGRTVRELRRDGERVSGLLARAQDGSDLELRCKLVIGADGRGSSVAKLAGVRERRSRNGRFAYGGYYEGPPPEDAPTASLWFLDPDMAAAFPTDGDLTFYAAMPSRKRLDAFRGDPAEGLVRLVSKVPDAPPIAQSRLVGQVQGKLDMTNVWHAPTAPGLALVGDAVLAADPLWGVGCGWAFQSAEWLADSVAGALRGAEPLERGLARYRRRHSRGLKGHTFLMNDYSTGRRMNPMERKLFSTATHNKRLAHVMEGYGTRNIGPARMFASALPIVAQDAARRSLRRGTQPHVSAPAAGGAVQEPAGSAR
jgi:2-polyprenyl-6-methoxyphenol hydroxylase-like FAD-dependent oxidoreductase